MKNIGIIGCGRIGGPVIKAIQSGQAGDYTLGAVLTRNQQQLDHILTIVDPDVFFSQSFDLVIDTGGPTSMAQHAGRILETSDLWTVNAAALADPTLYELLESTGERFGNRLRVLSGAIAGLDGVATLSIDGDAVISTTVDVAPNIEGRKSLFKGSVREAAKLFPDSVNVAFATGLAASAVDKVQVEVIQPAEDEARTLGIKVTSQYGHCEVLTIPNVIPPEEIHTVAACIIAALRKENLVIWVG